MQDIDTPEARGLLLELRDHEVRHRYLRELFAKGEVDSGRLDDEQLVTKILQLRRGAFDRAPSHSEDVEEFARATGNTHEGARIMIATDDRYGTHTFVRGSAPSDAKASPRQIKELREKGHSPKPAFIKMGSGPDGMFQPTQKDFEDGTIQDAMDEGWLTLDSAGYMVDVRQRLPDGTENKGFGKRYVSDVDLALILTRSGPGTASCDQATYSSVLRSNSWFYNQSCSCTHGAFTRWNSTTPLAVATKSKLTNKHLIDKTYGHRGLSASQIGRSELLRPPKPISPEHLKPENLKNATFTLVEGEPLIAFIGGRVFRTYINRLYLDLIAFKLRGF